MSLTRKIAHNTIIQIVGKIFSTALGLLALGLMTRYLGQEKFGWYVTTVSFLQFIGILVDFGLIPVTAQMLSEPEHDKPRLIKNLLGFRLATAVVAFGIAPLIALLFPYPPEVKIAIAFSTISFLAIALNQILTGFYQTELKMHVTVAAELIGRVVLVVGIWLLVYQQASFLPMMALIMISNVTQVAALWWQARRLAQLRFSFDLSIWKKIIIKMWPIAISIIFNVVYLRGDVLLLSLWRPQAEVGLYGGAYRVLDILTQLGMLMMGVMLPLMAAAWARDQKDEFAKRYQQSFDMLMLFGVPMTVGACLLSEKIMRLIGGEKFVPAGSYLTLLSLAVFGVYLGSVFGHTAVALGKQRQTIWIYLSCAIITLSGYLIFIPTHGATGAAWMSMFSELYVGFLLFYTVRKHSGVALEFKTFGKILLASAVMGASILLFQTLPVIFIIVLGMGIYGAVLIFTKAVSIETVREIVSLKS